jgi:hypothetical protein
VPGKLQQCVHTAEAYSESKMPSLSSMLISCTYKKITAVLQWRENSATMMLKYFKSSFRMSHCHLPKEPSERFFEEDQTEWARNDKLKPFGSRTCSRVPPCSFLATSSLQPSRYR